MRKVYLFDMGLLVVAGAVAAVLAKEPVHPEKLSRDDIDGEVLTCTDMLESTEDGNTTQDCTNTRVIDTADASGPG